MTSRFNRPLTFTLGALAAAAMLTACDKSEDPRTVGQQLDATVAQAEQQLDKAEAHVKAAGADAKLAVTQATDAVIDAAKDATITAAVNQELAKDSELSAIGIDVDTVNGRVSLLGKAPTATARLRATTLAASVDGVASVDNQLVVESKS